jgi:hypothetical protein
MAVKIEVQPHRREGMAGGILGDDQGDAVGGVRLPGDAAIEIVDDLGGRCERECKMQNAECRNQPPLHFVRRVDALVPSS